MVSQASLAPTKEDRVARCREDFSIKSEDELIFVLQNNLEHSPEHIAAKQLLSSMQEAKEQRRHTEVLAETTRANTLSKIAIGIAIFAAAVAVAALALQWRDSPASKPTIPVASQTGREVQTKPQPVQKAPTPAGMSKLPAPTQKPPKLRETEGNRGQTTVFRPPEIKQAKLELNS